MSSIKTVESWNRDLFKVFQGKYTMLERVGNLRSSKAKYMCKDHGPYEASMYYMSKSPTGACPTCYQQSRTPRYLPFEKAVEILETFYPEFTYKDFAEQYVGVQTPITLICPSHGEFTGIPLTISKVKIQCPECVNAKKRENEYKVFEAKALKSLGPGFKVIKETYKSSREPVTIVCPIHGESTLIPSSILHQGSTCRHCAISQRAEKFSIPFSEFLDRANKVHNSIYKYIPESYKGIRKNVTAVCEIHGEFSINATSHTVRKQGCQECSKLTRGQNNVIPFSEFLRRAIEVHGDTYTYLESSYKGMSKRITIQCQTHGDFKQLASDHVWYGCGCPKCNKVSISLGERELLAYVESLGLNVDSSFRYDGRKEFDILISDKNIAIEFDGLLWHSTKYRTVSNQLRKHKEANLLGIQLIRIFEDEWVYRKDQIKALLSTRLAGGLSLEKTHARQCTVRDVDDSTSRDFYDRFHVQGWKRSGQNLGLFLEGDLKAVMTFTSTLSSRKQGKSGEVELARYASKGRVLGGASKLLKAYIRKFSPSRIISYSDNRLFSGDLYKRLGFSKVSEVAPSYTYFNPRGSLERHHKSKFQRAHLPGLLGDSFDPSLSERENCERAGFYQVYDDGKTRWELVI